MKVKMIPHLQDVQRQQPSGVRKVVEKYFEHLPAYGVEMVAPGATSFDLLAIHAGASTDFAPNDPVVAHSHGLYWTDDYPAEEWEHEGNASVIHVTRHAKLVTVPSEWVAESFRRDMHLQPWVIPHGVDYEEWQGGENLGYILWNKNRDTDVCDPIAVTELALRMPQQSFLSTFAHGQVPANVRVTGLQPHERMKEMVKGAALYLATTKETYGIGTLEALAAGVPVLGWDWGGTRDIVQHGRTGYLAQPGDYLDLLHGANYILRHRKYMSLSARDAGRANGWDHAVHLLSEAYAATLRRLQTPAKVAVVIPCYNKADTVVRAARSVMRQTVPVERVIVVNNNSTDGFDVALRELKYMGVEVVNCSQQGVAHARNYGIALADDCEYVCCLDADDEIAPDFIYVCGHALTQDNSLGIAYTGITAVREDGERFVSDWPGQFDYENFIVGKNQVPTCCVFRRELWQRAGGYRQRFAPRGAGAEDAEFFLRLGSLGANGKKVNDDGLFIYYLGGAVSGDPHYSEPNWRAGKPWVEDRRHPFASVAKPANGYAHLVRQYDEPLVSIVVPVGPGHVDYLVDCLDSIEAQSNRQWECIVVGDVPGDQQTRLQERLDHGYPWVRLVWTTVSLSGAGVARNIGASFARGQFLLFVDADDWLTPNALNILLAGYAQEPYTIIYGPYIGHALIDDPVELARLRARQRLLDYNEQTNEATVKYDAEEFDCEKALRQPDARRPYIWNIISSLVPKAYHDEIGGFDESMKSWEDWDYWLRMARSNHCFTRVTEPVLEYRFYSGGRRALANPLESGEYGRQLSSSLLEYMQDKYSEDNMPGCRSCGSKRQTTPQSVPMNMSMMTTNNGGINLMSGEDFVTVELIDGNIGNHRIVFQRQDYGYRAHGDKFLMRKVHADADRRVRIVQPEAVAPAAAPSLVGSGQSLSMPASPKKPLAEPALTVPESATVSRDFQMVQTLAGSIVDEPDKPALDEPREVTHDMQAAVSVGEQNAPAPAAAPATEQTYTQPAQYDFTLVWGIGEDRANLLKARGLRSLSSLVGLEATGIQKMLNVPLTTAERIFSSAKELSDKK